MLGLGLERCDLGLSHGLAGHCHSEASDVGACLWIWWEKSLRVWNVPSYTHLQQNALPDANRQTMRLWAQVVAGLCPVIGSHSALLSVTATHATALDAYLFWRRRSSPRGTSFHRCQLGHKDGENVAVRDQNYSATVQTSASSMVVTRLSVLQVCRLFMYLHIGGECFLPVIRFYSNYFILFLFSTYVLFFK